MTLRGLDILASADIIAAEQNTALEALGLTVYVLPNPLALDDLYTNIETVAALTGHPEEATALNDALRADVAKRVGDSLSQSSVKTQETIAGLQTRPWPG